MFREWRHRPASLDVPADPIFDRKRFGAFLLGLTLLSLVTTLYGIDAQPPTGDDYGTALTAIHYLENGQLGPTMWNHPGLRNILVGLSLKAFGPGVVGVKFWSILFGVLTAPLLALVAARLFRNDTVAFLAGVFMALDPVRIDFSRQGINDVYLAFFPLAGLLLVLVWGETRRSWLLPTAGLLFGCGLASKWSVALQLSVAIGYVVNSLVRDESLTRGGRVSELAFLAASLVALPLSVYLLTYLPWFGRGYGIGDWLELQGQMWLETRTHTGYLQIDVERDHRAWEWFLRPVAHQTFILPSSAASGSEGFQLLLSFGNPLVWLLTLPAVAWLGYDAVRRRDRGCLLATALFLVSYLPFVLTSRPIWVNTALAVIPYGFMATAHLLWSVAQRHRGRTYLLAVYLVLVALTTLPLFLLATGRGAEFPLLRPIVERSLPRHADRPAAPAKLQERPYAAPAVR